MPLTLGQLQKQIQHLVMTPQMQQSIKLLQMNSLELEQLTEELMLENPFLELSDEQDVPTRAASAEKTDATPETPASTSAEKPQDMTVQPEAFDKVDVDWEEVYDDAENRVYYQRENYEEHDFTEYTAIQCSLHEDLMRQIRLSSLAGVDIRIAEYIVGCLDEDGYLKTDLSEIAKQTGTTLEQVEDVLEIVQGFDPPGIAARDLAECLRLQLEDMNVRGSFIYRLIDEHLEDLQKKKFQEIAREMDVEEGKVIEAFHQISQLEPKPGRSRTKDQPQYITPDVVVKKIDGKYYYSLNEGRSAYLTINPYYQKLLAGNNMSREEKSYTLEKFRGAVWFLKSIEKRKSTILRITEAIMHHQKDFLENGLNHLKPLTLREIAEEVQMHESTVARVTSGKYVETPRGIFELKFFFSSGIEKEDGESTSSTSVKEMIMTMIQQEAPGKPLSDKKIAAMLSEKGIVIARRTVAKYREQLRILPAKLRKEVAHSQ